MDDREQQRKIRHRLAVLRHAEEVTGNVAATCRYYGISQPTFYKWRNRYEELGPDGLRDRSSRPHRHSTSAARKASQRGSKGLGSSAASTARSSLAASTQTKPKSCSITRSRNA